MDKNYTIAENVLGKIGGKENVASVAHCITRLRFNLKDESLVDEAGLKKIPGVLGATKGSGQYMVIIGQNVPKVYDHLCKIGNFSRQSAIDEDLDKDLTANRFSARRLFDGFMNYISGTVNQILPGFVAAGLFKTLMVILGPDTLGVISAESDLYILLDFLYDAMFYFLPVYLAFAAAKTLKTSTVLAVYCACLLIVPDFTAMIGVRESFSVFGVPVPVASYAQTFLPIVLGVWVMSLVYRFFTRVIPDVLSTLLNPLLTLAVMTPVMFAVCAPLGNYCGELIGGFFIYMSEANAVLRIIGCMLLGGLTGLLVLFGMHNVIVLSAVTVFTTVGYEAFCLTSMMAYSWTIVGMGLGAALKMKVKENKAEAFGYFATAALAGISEPTLYGVCLKYRRNLRILIGVGAIGGIVVGILQPRIYVMMAVTNVFSVMPMFVAGGAGNIAAGAVVVLGCVIMGAVATYLFGDFGDD